MSKALLFQLGVGPTWAPLLKASEPWHQACCVKHRIDMWQIQSQAYPHIPVIWQVPIYMNWAFDRGYEFVVYLDADTLIVNQDVDLREALREKPLGMIRGQVPGGEPLHYNAGAIYARNESHIVDLWAEMSRLTPPTMNEQSAWWKDPNNSQTVLNRLIDQGWADYVESIDRRWNSTVESENTVVLAWHGVPTAGNKLAAMRKRIESCGQVRAS
jgi:hypothetical protein